MHVALITTSYPDDGSGSEAAGSFVADFAIELAKTVPVTVIAAARASSTARDGNLTVIRFDVPRLPLSLLRPFNPADWLAIIKTMQNGRRVLDEVVSESTPSFIFALWALPSGDWAAQVARRHGIPFGIWALGSDIWSLGRIPLLRARLRRILRAADRCYADGLSLAKDVEQVSGRSCEFLPSTRQLPPRGGTGGSEEPPFKLAFLGRWHRNKGIDILLAALQQLSDSEWSRISAVRIFGGGPLQDDVQRMTGRLTARNRPVELGGYLDKQHAAELIDWADYLIVPSRVESIPVIFSDALQQRTAMIATPVGDLPRLQERHSFGVLSKSVTADALADALRQALDRSPKEFRAGLDALASEFDLPQIVRRFMNDIAESRK